MNVHGLAVNRSFHFVYRLIGLKIKNRLVHIVYKKSSDSISGLNMYNTFYTLIYTLTPKDDTTARLVGIIKLSLKVAQNAKCTILCFTCMFSVASPSRPPNVIALVTVPK